MDTTEPRTTCYTERATATRQRRNYPTRAQIKAGRKLINEGTAGLSKEELLLLATHPDMGYNQRDGFRAMLETFDD